MRKNIIIVSVIVIGLLIGGYIFGMPYYKNVFYINKNVNPSIEASGIKLSIPETQVVEILGGAGEKAMCVYGYEYTYGDLGLNIGFRADNERVRRITITNNKDQIFGLKAGMTMEEAKTILNKNGFIKDEKSNFKFSKKNTIITIKSLKGDMVDGVTIEIYDEALIQKVY